MKTIVDSLKVLGESTRMFESLRDNLFAPKGLKFNSQICTTREQSERLLALGLKRETADMVWTHAYYGTWVATASENPLYEESDSVPAWSLHRLIEMKQPNTIDNSVVVLSREQTYDKLIGMIAKSIKEGYFNKEYLV